MTAKERPIVFRPEMVEAILAGRKGETRRIIQKQPPVDYHRLADDSGIPFKGRVSARFENDTPPLGMWTTYCPYGQPGDRLWVRETWAPTHPEHPRVRVSYKADMTSYGLNGGFADDLIFPEPLFLGSKVPLPARWKSPRYMPRWASRILLEIVDIRVERLFAIDEQGAEREGAWQPAIENNDYLWTMDREEWAHTAREAFLAYWDRLNAKRGYRGDHQIWVWVVEFKVILEPSVHGVF